MLKNRTLPNKFFDVWYACMESLSFIFSFQTGVLKSSHGEKVSFVRLKDCYDVDLRNALNLDTKLFSLAPRVFCGETS